MYEFLQLFTLLIKEQLPDWNVAPFQPKSFVCASHTKTNQVLCSDMARKLVLVL
jgi:hypothetical protein